MDKDKNIKDKNNKNSKEDNLDFFGRKKLNKEEKKLKWKTIGKDLLEYALIIVVVLLIKHFIICPIKVTGDSMNPTLEDKDLMILDVIGYKINGLKRFDIVVFKYDGEKLIKRVIGLPGDTVEYRGSNLYINGEEMGEDFRHYTTKDFYQEKIPEGYYFVLGDNRTNSKDSRVFGLVKEDSILGRTSFVFYPFNRAGSKIEKIDKKKIKEKEENKDNQNKTEIN